MNQTQSRLQVKTSFSQADPFLKLLNISVAD